MSDEKKVLTSREETINKLEELHKKKYITLDKEELIEILISKLDIDDLSDSALANRLCFMSNDEFSFNYIPKYKHD